MATPTGTLWSRDPHTAAKHQMLRSYLAAWFPIIAGGFGKAGLTYVDAFAGPGEYAGGEPGSPIIALRQAHRFDVATHQAPIRLVFIEKRKRRAAHLRSLIDKQFPASRQPSTIHHKVHTGSCEELLIPALSDIGSRDEPLFVNFDGWGVDTPFYLLAHVGRRDAAEVLITFQAQWFVRFVKDRELEAGDKVFGGRDWRSLAASGTPLEKKSRLVDHYLDRLKSVGFPYSLTFELVDEQGHELFLVYGTSSELGVSKMKDAMWKVDPVYGHRFRDPRDLNQLSLGVLTDPDLSLLKSQILTYLDGRGSVALADLKRFTLLDTIFKPSHTKPAVEVLEGDYKVHCERARKHKDFTVRLAPQSLF